MAVVGAGRPPRRRFARSRNIAPIAEEGSVRARGSGAGVAVEPSGSARRAATVGRPAARRSVRHHRPDQTPVRCGYAPGGAVSLRMAERVTRTRSGWTDTRPASGKPIRCSESGLESLHPQPCCCTGFRESVPPARVQGRVSVHETGQLPSSMQVRPQLCPSGTSGLTLHSCRFPQCTSRSAIFSQVRCFVWHRGSMSITTVSVPPDQGHHRMLPAGRE